MVEFFQDHPTPEAWQAVSKLDHLIGLSVDAHGRRLGGVTGLRSLHRLTDVVVKSGEIDGPSLDEFVSIPNLRAFEGQFTDDGLEKLTRAKNLVELDIRPDLESTITEEGLVHLTKLGRLKNLSLFSLKIKFTDRSLQILAPILSNLEILHLKSASTSDQGVLLLKGCHRLKSLEIWSVRLTDKCFTTMSGLENLQELDLHISSFTDAGLAPLQKLSKLKGLSLSGDRLTAAGLELLIPLARIPMDPLAPNRIATTH